MSFFVRIRHVNLMPINYSKNIDIISKAFALFKNIGIILMGYIIFMETINKYLGC